ncbi:hypothetical protein RB195_000996 [Necator americanus]|uniref:Uncharacterized protein n=1 Tax=Necator americanus TaxID=51031 RepID=A0ABR1DCR9_NECAM
MGLFRWITKQQRLVGKMIQELKFLRKSSLCQGGAKMFEDEPIPIVPNLLRGDTGEDAKSRRVWNRDKWMDSVLALAVDREGRAELCSRTKNLGEVVGRPPIK